MRFKKIKCDKCKGHGEISPLIPLRKELNEKIGDKDWDGKEIYISDLNDIMDWLFNKLNKLNTKNSKKEKKQNG